jgi:curved DNA-binding protein
MQYKDYYKTLGVERIATKDQLKKEYRKLARKFHPDVNTTDKHASVKFAEINEAYNVLIDDEKRRKYDELGADWEQYENTGQKEDFDWSKYAFQNRGQEEDPFKKWQGGFGMGEDHSDFFRTIFGQGYGNQEEQGFAMKGQDLGAELTLSLKDAYEGGTQILTIGTNRIRIKLKPGIWDRQKIKIDGKGLPGRNGGSNGDLYITFILESHPEYRMDGIDLYKDIPLSIYSALLGATLKVQTISGNFNVVIPPETQNGTVFRLKKKGFPVYDKPGVQGDLFLRVQLQLPAKLTEQEIRLIRELAELRTEKVVGGNA